MPARILITAVLLASGPALAVFPPEGENVLGLYTAADETARVNASIVFDQLDLYVVLTGCTCAGGIVGVDLCVQWPEPGLIAGDPEWNADLLPPGEDPCRTRFAVPLPTAEIMVLASWTPFILSSGFMFVHFAPPAEETLPGSLAIYCADEPDTPIPAGISSGAFDCPVFAINTGFRPLCWPAHGVRTTRSWSAVKALFR